MAGISLGMLQYKVTEIGNSCCMSLQGRIDGTTSNDVERQLKELLLHGMRNLIVDFEQVNYISSAGLRVFLLVQKQLKQAGGEIMLAALPTAVQDVFRVSGFTQVFRIAETQEAAVRMLGDDTPAIDTTYKTLNNITFAHQKKADVSRGTLLSIGNPDKLPQAAYEENDVASLTSSDISFGTGLATVGNTYSDYKDFFGEALVINKHIFFYPAAKRPVVDFMLYAGDQTQLTYRFLHGFGFRGSFTHLVAFHGDDSPIQLSQLKTFLLSLTDARAAGIVLIAESKGIWGMHLKQVPTDDRKAINGEDIFSSNNFSNWFNFPVEPSDVNHIVAAVGLITQDDVPVNPAMKKLLGGEEREHFHACIFQKDILSKKPEHFAGELNRVLTELTPLKVQHILGQTTFSSGLAGIIELQEKFD
jgi:anti-anti-sigma factor